MRQVFIVSRRKYKRAYHAEPYWEECIVSVFDSSEKAIEYISESIKRDYEFISLMAMSNTSSNMNRIWILFWVNAT